MFDTIVVDCSNNIPRPCTRLIIVDENQLPILVRLTNERRNDLWERIEDRRNHDDFVVHFGLLSRKYQASFRQKTPDASIG